ncbi:hypothetical protein [Halobellus sp. EA9]|uniref:hypothetical protein n=1 Tax=Halobellus sp. EA9 TaxID=3421647 RepID=UPI003EBF3FD6
MRVECPYCDREVDVTSLKSHVRRMEGGGHVDHGTVPRERVDSPWNIRIETSPAEARADRDSGLDAEYVEERIRRGRCPGCDLGVVGLKGGDGWLSSGRRRLACPNCGWESPEWVTIRD